MPTRNRSIRGESLKYTSSSLLFPQAEHRGEEECIARRFRSACLAGMSLIALGASAPSGSSIPPETRAKLLMALLGVTVLGIGLVAVVLLAGWSVRRLTRDDRSKKRTMNQASRTPPPEPPAGLPDVATPPDAATSSDAPAPPFETRRLDETGRADG